MRFHGDYFSTKCDVRHSVQSVLRDFVDTFCYQFQRKYIRSFQTYRKILIWSVLKSTVPGASNGGSNFEFWSLEAVLLSFDEARLPCHTRENGKIVSSEFENGPKCVWKLKTQSCKKRSEKVQDKCATSPHTFQRASEQNVTTKSQKGVGVRIVLQKRTKRVF